MDKFVFLQYNNLIQEEINNLGIVLEEFYKDTGITCVILPKEIELLNKEEIKDLIEQLKNQIKD